MYFVKYEINLKSRYKIEFIVYRQLHIQIQATLYYTETHTFRNYCVVSYFAQNTTPELHKNKCIVNYVVLGKSQI